MTTWSWAYIWWASSFGLKTSPANDSATQWGTRPSKEGLGIARSFVQTSLPNSWGFVVPLNLASVLKHQPLGEDTLNRYLANRRSNRGLHAYFSNQLSDSGAWHLLPWQAIRLGDWRSTTPIDGLTWVHFYLHCHARLEATASSPKCYGTLRRTS
jgi:hypothetical protein